MIYVHINNIEHENGTNSQNRMSNKMWQDMFEIIMNMTWWESSLTIWRYASIMQYCFKAHMAGGSALESSSIMDTIWLHEIIQLLVIHVKTLTTMWPHQHQVIDVILK